LGANGDEQVGVDEGDFRTYLGAMLRDVPVSRRTFLLAVHYAYGLCKGWDLSSKPVLLFHLHATAFLKGFVQDFPDAQILHMVRNPGSSLHSTVRRMGVGDQEKLNLTDSLIYAGRQYWLACQLQIEALSDAEAYLNRDNVKSVKLESLHQQHEFTMRSVAGWLGLEFSGGMLESTFDGKLWWGDTVADVPVNGLDPQAMSERWKASLNKTDVFVIEGILSHLYSAYGYDQTTYRHDTRWNRLLLTLAILLPSKIEKRTLAFYLNPLTHLRLLRAALDESTGRLPRKDYTWNATYRYKYTYVGLNLWRTPWYHRLLTFANDLPEGSGRQRIARMLIPLSRAVYVGAQYGRYCLAIGTYPREIFRRWRLCYRGLRGRLSQRDYWPPLLD